MISYEFQLKVENSAHNSQLFFSNYSCNYSIIALEVERTQAKYNMIKLLQLNHKYSQTLLIILIHLFRFSFLNLYQKGKRIIMALSRELFSSNFKELHCSSLL